MKHSPGPWKVLFTYHVEGESGDGHTAEISYHLDSEDIPTEAEVEANAKLMAAAPDLLFACKLAEAQLIASGANIKALRRAIEKGEGKS